MRRKSPGGAKKKWNLVSFTLNQAEMCVVHTVAPPTAALPSGDYEYLNLQMGRSKLREVLGLESHQNQRISKRALRI